MKPPRDELVTIEGTVVGTASDRAPVATAALVVGDGELPFEHRASFDVETPDGRRVTVEPAKNPVIRPARKAAGAWREIEQHPVRPTGDFHPDGHVKLRGEWIVPGERVVVIGYVKEHAFVPDTGGHREAPAREVSLVRAIAIGTGDDAAEAAQDAVRDREREIAARNRPKRAASDATWGWWSLGAFALAAVLVVVDFETKTETLGVALAITIFALLFGWRASPTELFPGGAVDEDEVTTPGVMLGMILVLLVPLTAILFWLAGGEPGRRNGLTNAGWVMLGLLPIWKVVAGAVGKPRAEKGSQIRLPASPVRRWILVIGLVATWIASIALAVPHLSGDGPMT